MSVAEKGSNTNLHRLYVHVDDVMKLRSGHFPHSGFAAKTLPDGTFLCAIDTVDPQCLRHVLQTIHADKVISLMPSVASGKEVHHHLKAQAHEHVKNHAEAHGHLTSADKHDTYTVLGAFYLHQPEPQFVPDGVH